MTLIGEEFGEGPVALDSIAIMLEGAIIKRRVQRREHGVALVAEGLIERLDPDTLGTTERDPYGNVRLAELELSRLLKERVAASSATRFLVEGGTEAMVTIQAEMFVPVPFSDLVDTKAGRFRVRYVDVTSEAYRMLAAYMIRLTRADFEDPDQLRALARAGALSEAEFAARFAGSVRLGKDTGP